MIKDLSPPWIHPKPNEPVKALASHRRNYLDCVYDFKTNSWNDLIGKEITIIGWVRK